MDLGWLRVGLRLWLGGGCMVTLMWILGGAGEFTIITTSATGLATTSTRAYPD
jgi:hypothetical protein